MFPKRSDRSEHLMTAYWRRVEATFQFIVEHPAIPTELCYSTLSLDLRVKPDRVEEYVRTLGNAGKITAQGGRLYEVGHWHEMKARDEREEHQKELAVIQSAKDKGSSPLDGYSTESDFSE
jgi:hypothetical protein